MQTWSQDLSHHGQTVHLVEALCIVNNFWYMITSQDSCWSPALFHHLLSSMVTNVSTMCVGMAACSLQDGGGGSYEKWQHMSTIRWQLSPQEVSELWPSQQDHRYSFRFERLKTISGIMSSCYSFYASLHLLWLLCSGHIGRAENFNLTCIYLIRFQGNIYSVQSLKKVVVGCLYSAP